VTRTLAPTLAPTARPTRTPVPTSPPPDQPGRVTYAELGPDGALPGSLLHASVQTAGTVSRVVMYLGSGIPGPVSPIAATLVRVSAATWSGTMRAPSVSGQYHFTVGIFDRAGRRSIADYDAWNVTIGSTVPAATPTTAETVAFPDDIPLVPPFSYSNPVSASFSAEGRSISGYEVTSNSRPDVAASAVGNFYTARLPRSGWAVDASTVPPPGATSFTLAATKGNRVCVVDFANGVVQIFYSS
jgi:hypothetical protein